jgi:hypothetical protein
VQNKNGRDRHASEVSCRLRKACLKAWHARNVQHSIAWGLAPQKHMRTLPAPHSLFRAGPCKPVAYAAQRVRRGAALHETKPCRAHLSCRFCRTSVIFLMALTVLCTSSRSYFSGRLRRRSISNVASCDKAPAVQAWFSRSDRVNMRGS